MSGRGSDYLPPPEVARAGAATVGGLFAATARLNRHRTALVEGARSLTYGALDARVDRLAGVLRGLGAGRGDRVAVLARNCIAFLEVELAAARIGAVVVGLNWRWAEAEIAHGLALTAPRAVVAAPEFEAALRSVGRAPDLVTGPAYEAALDAAQPALPGPVESEDGLVVLFTSGTTGLPKGALVSHRAIVTRALIYAAEFAPPKDDTFVAWSPLFHMGANDFALATLLRGGRVVVVDGYRPDEIVRAVETWPVHYLTVVPGMIEDFAARLKASRARPKRIGMIGAMADLVPRPLLEEITTLLDAPYVNTFGSTETGTPPASAGLIPVGTAPERLSKTQTGFCEIRLVDEDGGDVPDGAPGELAIRGPSLFSGYWRDDAANREAFRGGWFHMGDVFRRDPDGKLDFVDRAKYMIKSGGENVYPAEIERHILADPRILDAVVVRKPDDRWGEVPVVFAAGAEGGLTEDDVIGMCRGRIAGFKLPREVRFLAPEDFPRSLSGKVQRHVLEARLKPGRERPR